jgi:hypothetical protein
MKADRRTNRQKDRHTDKQMKDGQTNRRTYSQMKDGQRKDGQTKGWTDRHIRAGRNCLFLSKYLLFNAVCLFALVSSSARKRKWYFPRLNETPCLE